MKKHLTKLWLVILMLISAPLLMADVGPKPTVEFEIEYLIEPVPDLVGYTLYECDQPDCSDSSRLEQIGPQFFECTQFACTSMAYDYADYMYIVLVFNDASTRISDTFTKEHFNARYRVTVNRDGLLVEEIGGDNRGHLGIIGSLPLLLIFLLACGGLLILGIIVLVVVMIVRSTRQPRTEQK